jgi:Tfp pilus assembly protein PilF
LTVRILNNLAASYSLAGRSSDADATYRRAMSLAGTQSDLANGTYVRLLANYAAFLRKSGRRHEKRRCQVRVESQFHWLSPLE